jgi:hypothetical protein
VTAETTASLQARSARTRRLITALWAGCAALVLLERFSAATIHAVRANFATPTLQRLGCEAATAIPEVLFLLGLWWVREALAAFARGELFGPSVTRMLDRVGIALVAGAILRIALVPGICRLLGDPIPYWIAVDASALVLGAIGIALKSIANVLRRASAIETELGEIF